MDKQLIFDTAVNGIREQGKRAIKDTKCVYRAPDGCKCAVGHMIPDDKYDPRLENFTASAKEIIYSLAPEFGVEYNQESGEFLRGLQVCHDAALGSVVPSDRSVVRQIADLNFQPIERQEELVESAFEEFAQRYGLSYERKPWKRD